MAEGTEAAEAPPPAGQAEEAPPVATPAQDPPVTAPGVKPETPPADPAQTKEEPPPEEPPPLTDEQVMEALRDPRAAAILEYTYGQVGATAEAPAGSPPATAAPSGDGEFLGKVAALAKEGDVDGIQTAVAEETGRTNAERATAEAEKKAVDTARRNTLGALAEVEELQNLNASQQLRLIKALQQSDGAFVREAGLVIAEKQRGASHEASAATAEAAGATARAPATPDLPAASPVVSGPPIPEGEEAKHKSGYEVLQEFFSWEDEKPS